MDSTDSGANAYFLISLSELQLLAFIVLILGVILFIILGGPIPTRQYSDGGTSLFIGCGVTFSTSLISICFLKCEDDSIIFALILITALFLALAANSYAAYKFFDAKLTTNEVSKYCKQYFLRNLEAPPAIVVLQTLLPCCGGENFEDFLYRDRVRQNKFTVPDSCCLERNPETQVVETLQHTMREFSLQFLSKWSILTDRKETNCGKEIPDYNKHEWLANHVNELLLYTSESNYSGKALVIKIMKFWLDPNNLKKKYLSNTTALERSKSDIPRWQRSPKEILNPEEEFTTIIQFIMDIKVTPFGCAALLEVIPEAIEVFVEEDIVKLIAEIVLKAKSFLFLTFYFCILMTILNTYEIVSFLYYYLKYCGKDFNADPEDLVAEVEEGLFTEESLIFKSEQQLLVDSEARKMELQEQEEAKIVSETISVEKIETIENETVEINENKQDEPRGRRKQHHEDHHHHHDHAPIHTRKRRRSSILVPPPARRNSNSVAPKNQVL